MAVMGHVIDKMRSVMAVTESSPWNGGTCPCLDGTCHYRNRPCQGGVPMSPQKTASCSAIRTLHSPSMTASSVPASRESTMVGHGGH